MASDSGSELENNNLPKSEVIKSSENSEGTKKTAPSNAFREAIGRARDSIQERLGRGIKKDPLWLSGEAKRKLAEAAPEGYKWVTNEPKLEDFETEEVAAQKQYIEGLREKNDVHFGEAFDIYGKAQPEYRGVYIKPKTEPQK